MTDLRQAEFSIIYSVDVSKGTSLTNLTPPNYPRRWQCTEKEESERFPKGRYRKHVAILSFEEFCDFLEHVGLVVEKTRTLGSLGAPGCGFGLSPAVPFMSYDDDSVQNAYVTPLFPIRDDPILPGFPEDIRMLDWEPIEKEMWEWFEDGFYSAREMAKEMP
jgi:hypothetical protein